MINTIVVILGTLIVVILGSLMIGGYLYFLLLWIFRLPRSLSPDYFKQGTRMFYRGKYAAAVTRYTRAIEKNSGNVNAYLCRAYCYFCMDELDKALEDCDTVTEMQPDNHTAFFYRGSIYARKEDYHRSVAESTHCLELQPDFHDAYLNRGYSFIYLGKDKEAIADYSKAIELSPSNIDAVVERGNLYLNSGQFQEAIEDFSEARKLGDQSWETFSSRGYAFQKMGNVKSAKADFEHALKLNPFDEAILRNPEDTSSYLQRGKLYYCAEQNKNAINDFSRVMELTETSAELLVCRGYCYIQLGEVDQAKADFQQAKALNTYSTAISENPDDSTNFLERGSLSLYLEEYELAIEDFTHALQLGERSAELLPSRGIAYLEIGEYEKAKQDFEEAVKKYPDSPHAFNGLAWILATCPDSKYRNGDRSLELARRNFELLTTPQWSDFGTLAAAYAETGQFEDAIQWAQKSMAIVPEHEKSNLEAQLKCYENNQAYTDLNL